MTNNLEAWEVESEWEEEKVDHKKELIRFIINEVKLGTSREELIDKKVLDFIGRNKFPRFKKSEVINMIEWTIKTFPTG